MNKNIFPNAGSLVRLYALIAVFLGLAACGGGGGGSTVSPPPPPPPVVRTPQNTVFLATDTTLNQVHLFTAGDEGGGVTAVTAGFSNPNGNVTAYDVSPDGSTIAYAADATVDGTFELFIVPTSGGTSTQASSGFTAGTAIRQIEWSPDSTQVAYIATPLGVGEVFMADRDGSNHRKISGSVGAGPSVSLFDMEWSPDGRYLVQSVLGLGSPSRILGYNIHDTSIGGFNSTRITQTVDWQNQGYIDTLPQWSPNSDRIVYVASFQGAYLPQVYTTEIASLSTTRLSTPAIANAGADVTQLRVSPDGQKVAYVADHDVAGRFDLNTVDIDGSDRTLVSSGRMYFGNYPVYWSPDSTRLLFSHDRETTNVEESFVANADGSNAIRINQPIASGQRALAVGWSPDGTSIAYMGDPYTNDQYELFVVDADGSNERQISSMPTNGGFGQFTWSPDSTMIAYVSNQNSSGQELFVSTADGLTNTRVNADLPGREEVAYASFRSKGFKWSEDSSRIVFSLREYTGGGNYEPRSLWVGTTDGAAPIELNGTYQYDGSYAY